MDCVEEVSSGSTDGYDIPPDVVYDQLTLNFDFVEPPDVLAVTADEEDLESIHSSTNIPKGWFKRRIAIGATGLLLTTSGHLLEQGSEAFLSRDVIAEPFDVADHIGNTREAAMITVASFIMLAMKSIADYDYMTVAEDFKLSVTKAALGAFAISSAIQAIGEKFELSPGFGGNSGDMLDALYGIGYSGIVALASYGLVMKLAKRYRPQPPEYLSRQNSENVLF